MITEPAPPRRADQRTVRSVVAVRALTGVASFTLPFLAAVFVSAFGASEQQAGWAMAAFGVATIPSRLLGGWLTDRLPARDVIAIGLIACAVSQAAIAAAPGLPAAVAAGVGLGLAFEVFEPATRVALSDAAPGRHRVRAFTLLAAALGVAGVASGLLAVVLARGDLRVLPATEAAVDLVGAVVVLVAVRRHHPRPRDPLSGSGPSPWRDRRLLTMFTTGVCAATTEVGVIVALPLILPRHGLSVDTAGALMALAAGVLVVTHVAPMPGRPFIAIRRGFLFIAVGLLVGACASTLPWFVVAVVVWAVGDAVMLSHPFAVVADLADDTSRGRYFAAYGLTYGIAFSLAPVLVTQLLRFGDSTFLLAAAAVALALAAAQPLVERVVHADEVASRR